MSSSNYQNYTIHSNTDNKTLISNLKKLPSKAQWLEHADLLLKFWLHDDAQGVPIGNFPTWRNNDGTLIHSLDEATTINSIQHRPPCELQKLFSHYCIDLNVLIKRQYVRMMSRQTFTYGALFNLTGNPQALKLHLAGVNYLLNHARDENGIFYTFFENGKGQPKLKKRAIQDLAGTTLGLAMNAYLTHSHEAITAIEKIRAYIYEQCTFPGTDILKWIPEDFEADSASDIQLSPQLDELNCYLLLLWRLLPKTYQSSWTKSIQKSLNVIDQYFTASQAGTFYGSLSKLPGTSSYIGQPTNYGHGVKTWWMKDIAASLMNDAKVRSRAIQGIWVYAKEALAPNGLSWFESANEDTATWWVWAELDQAILHSALAANTPIPGTIKTWTQELTDKIYGEINLGQKQHFWRNGYHSSEHALIGYIISQGLRERYPEGNNIEDTNVTLHFAMENYDPATPLTETGFTPYYYSGDIKKLTIKGQTQEVVFNRIRTPDPLPIYAQDN